MKRRRYKKDVVDTSFQETLLRLESQFLCKMVGLFAETKDGNVVEIIGILDENPENPIVEWINGDKEGVSNLFSLLPTTDTPSHIKEFSCGDV